MHGVSESIPGPVAERLGRCASCPHAPRRAGRLAIVLACPRHALGLTVREIAGSAVERCPDGHFGPDDGVPEGELGVCLSTGRWTWRRRRGAVTQAGKKGGV